MKEIIDIFRMTEIDPRIRANIIILLGNAINFEHGANITEALVYQLVLVLDPENHILKDEFYKKQYEKAIKP